jgi:hypothetical protein
MNRTLITTNDRSRSNHVQSISNQISSRPRSHDLPKTIESNLRSARFHGVSVQRRSSLSNRSFVLSSNDANTKQIKPNSINIKSQKRRFSGQVFPSSVNRSTNPNNSSNFILNDSRHNSISNTTILCGKSSSKRKSDSQLESTNTKRYRQRQIFLFSIQLIYIAKRNVIFLVV